MLYIVSNHRESFEFTSLEENQKGKKNRNIHAIVSNTNLNCTEMDKQYVEDKLYNSISE